MYVAETPKLLVLVTALQASSYVRRSFSVLDLFSLPTITLSMYAKLANDRSLRSWEYSINTNKMLMYFHRPVDFACHRHAPGGNSG